MVSVPEPIPDFSRPGEEGALPAGAREWGRGMVYLAKRAIPSRLPPDSEYRIAVGFKLKQEQSAGYREVFRRVLEIAHARIVQIEGPLHVWTIAQGWMSLPGVPGIAVAFVALGLKSPRPGEDLPPGEVPPYEDAWTAPAGAPNSWPRSTASYHPARIDGPLQFIRKSWYSPSPNLVTVELHYS